MRYWRATVEFDGVRILLIDGSLPVVAAALASTLASIETLIVPASLLVIRLGPA